MADPNVYSAVFQSPAAWTNTGPLVQITVPASATIGASKSIEIIRCSVGIQVPASPVSAQQTVQLKTATAVWTSTSPTTITPYPLNGAERIAGSMAKCTVAAATVASTDGTGSLAAYQEGMNELGGFLYLPSPPERLSVSSGHFFTVNFLGTVTAATFNISIIWREYA